MPKEKLNSRELPLMKELQAALDMMPAGPERDHWQGVRDRLCDKIDALPHRAAVTLEGITDREERRAILTDECERVVSELPDRKND
jgi:hypothetical protein